METVDEQIFKITDLTENNDDMDDSLPRLTSPGVRKVRIECGLLVLIVSFKLPGLSWLQ